MRYIKYLFVGFAIASTAFGAQLLMSPAVMAADARNYNAGRIIDDTVFTNASSMTVSEIQNFINSKVTCDTYGAKTSELGGGTRAQWMASRGISAPFRCLRDYMENPSNGQNNYGTNTVPAGAISAAQIIYNYSRQFNINPQVLLVTLQKENGLVTDEWPTPRQFTQAMGFGCPDNVAPGAPACNPDYGGFSTQIFQAARLFRGFVDNTPGWYIPFTTGVNSIAWSPSSACGRGNVNIENRATVALYSYTPYQPNTPAKNAQYGTGDGCSAYGNRNFYLYFTDWFGSTYGTVQVTSPLQITSSVPNSNYTNRQLNFSFTLRNTSSARVDIGDMIIATRDSGNNNFDFGRQSITLNPGQIYTYNAGITLSSESDYTFAIGNYRESAGWTSNYPTSSIDTLNRSITTFIQALPTVTTSPTLAGDLRTERATSASFAIKNNSSRLLNLGKIGLAVRGPQGQNMDLPFDNEVSVNAGATYNYTKTISSIYAGNHQLSIASTKDGGVSWTGGNFPGATEPLVNSKSVTIKPGMTITEGLPSSSSYKVGQKVTLSFKVNNYTDNPVVLEKTGLFIRSPNGANYDPWWDTPTVQPRSEYSYSIDLYPDSTGDWRVWIGGLRSGSWIDNVLPREDGSIVTNTSFNATANPVISDDIELGAVEVRSNKQTSVQFKVANDGDKPISLELIGLSVRGPNNENLDTGWESPTIAPHTTYTYSKNITFPSTGTATISIGGKKGGQWISNPLPKADDSINTIIRPTILPGVSITQGITMSDNPTVGSHALTLVIRNYTSSSVDLGKIGIAVRDPNNANYDMLWENFIVPANSSKTHTVTIPFDKRGVWTAQIGNYNGVWNSTNPQSENAGIQRLIKFTIQ